MPGVEMGGAEGTAVDRWLLGTEEETESYTAFRGAGSLQRWFPRCPKVLVNCRFCLRLGGERLTSRLCVSTS